MKILAASILSFLLSQATTAAFAPVQYTSSMRSGLISGSRIMSSQEPLQQQEQETSSIASVAVEDDDKVQVTDDLPQMSTSMPFMARPAALTGALAGDVGFDPLGFAKTEADLMNYREAEVKHARLAMFAAAGWPISELFDKKIASVLGLNPLLDASDRAPSILNGGLGKVSPLYWIAILGAAAAIDFYGISKSKSGDASYFPGNLGFDPLKVYPKDEDGKKWMQLAEIKNGRLAMIAIFGFAIQEFVSKQGVVDETPLFFFPLMQTLKMYTNSGYIQ
jgi:Chlorophyll A-B binding protein.